MKEQKPKKTIFNSFWQWYEKHYVVNVSVATFLFVLQIVHLYWLSADVVASRLIGRSFFELTGIWEFIIVFVDYLEIPALISVSLIYINELRKGWHWKSFIYLVFLNSQWLHILWITDTFVIQQFQETSNAALMPIWLAWLAILIDYLELPVMFDTIKKFFIAMKKKEVTEFLKEDFAKSDH